MAGRLIAIAIVNYIVPADCICLQIAVLGVIDNRIGFWYSNGDIFKTEIGTPTYVETERVNVTTYSTVTCQSTVAMQFSVAVQYICSISVTMYNI